MAFDSAAGGGRRGRVAAASSGPPSESSFAAAAASSSSGPASLGRGGSAASSGLASYQDAGALSFEDIEASIKRLSNINRGLRKQIDVLGGGGRSDTAENRKLMCVR